MSNPFAGVGLFVFNFEGGGTPLSQADAQTYADNGCDYFICKVSDGVTGGGTTVVDQLSACQATGKPAYPWSFFYGSLSAAQQMLVLKEAAGGGAGGGGLNGHPAVFDIEEYVGVATFAGFADLLPALCSWGDPDQHPNAPSIGLFNDYGVTAQMPQAYPAAWAISPQAAVSLAMAQYNAIKPTPPISLVSDQGSTLVAYAQAAKAAGAQGIVAWRHGANGVTPASFAGLAGIFDVAPPPPSPPPPPPTPSPTQLVAGETYLTPKGDELILT